MAQQLPSSPLSGTCWKKPLCCSLRQQGWQGEVWELFGLQSSLSYQLFIQLEQKQCTVRPDGLPDVPLRHVVLHIIHPQAFHLTLEALAGRDAPHKAAGQTGCKTERRVLVVLASCPCPSVAGLALTHKHPVPSSRTLLRGGPLPFSSPSRHFPSRFPSFISQQSAR